MRKLLALFALLCVSFFGLAQVQIGGDSNSFEYGRPQQYEIGGITVSGTRFLDEQVLINISGLIIGDTIEIPGEKISKAIQNLWKQGLFSDVKISVVKV